MSEVDMDELNKIKETIVEKEKMMEGGQSKPQSEVEPIKGGSSEVVVAKQAVPVQQEPAPVAPTTVIFSPTIKEPISDRALSQTQKSSEAVGEMVTDIFKQGVVHVVANDQGVQEKILGTAKKAVEDKVDAISDQTTKEAQVSAYDANSDACENYGIMKDVPKWKINMMKAGSAFWFIVYFIFASLTVAPITIFVKGLVGVIKQVWLAVVVAIIFYLVVAVGIPYLITLI
jgi:hypothetical protein